MLGVELTLFIIVGAISIIAAVMMLVSENAVHSALFLIVNFACVAFFYLMLDAPFLAMVQVTVYAGAIMVLFLFVIMLLGAEKLSPESSPQFPWLTPVAIALTTVFLLVAGIAIIRSDIDTSEPEPATPLLRVVHAVGGAEAVDVYIDGSLFAENLDFHRASDFKEFSQGEHLAAIVPHGTELATENLLDTSVFLDGNDVITLVVIPSADGTNTLQALPVKGSLIALEDKDTVALTAINVLPCTGEEACALDIADTSDADNPQVLFADLDYAEISTTKILREGDYDLGAFNAGEIDTILATTGDDSDPVFDALTDFEQRHEFKGNDNLLWVITGENQGGLLIAENMLLTNQNNDAFGSGQSIGRRLFTKYMLPFQAIGLLLLVAMVGVIVMTNPLDGTKALVETRRVRRMAAVPGNPSVDEYQKQLDHGSGD
jgi:NADH:ubiquinone oxidoreductase subunit 6 (subunit J)